MEPFRTITGIAAPFDRVNVDTDTIIPKQFLKTIGRSGLARGLFYDLRTAEDGSPRADFVLNQASYRDARILVVGANFGCGSSREHAVWALLDAGIGVVISTSFADIFYQNCFKNGLLPVVVGPEDARALLGDAERGAGLTVNLEYQTITRPGGAVLEFEMETYRKALLLDGLDDIALTLKRAPAIDVFEQEQRERQPWLYQTSEK
ncbi:MAG: 3-isopropylmalate dehydratase small subunit [Gemmatimonadetes bacterium]|nr:3-isopropylmalate dehydratase small subunit [Gemmatimonadota bacterium]